MPYYEVVETEQQVIRRTFLVYADSVPAAMVAIRIGPLYQISENDSVELVETRAPDQVHTINAITEAKDGRDAYFAQRHSAAAGPGIDAG